MRVANRGPAVVQVLKLAQLRSFSRAVLFAGTPAQCRATVEVAEKYRDALVERGVLLIPLPIYAGDDGDAAAEVPPMETDDLRHADLRCLETIYRQCCYAFENGMRASFISTNLCSACSTQVESKAVEAQCLGGLV